MPKRPTPEIDLLIRQTAEKHNIPYELLYAQVQQESAFDPFAVSKCGARGLMQIMPETGRDLGLKEEDFFDSAKNLNAGAAYVKRMRKSCRFMAETLRGAVNKCTADDHWKLGLAAYNCGLGYVIKAINICKSDSQPLNWANIAVALSDKRCIVHGHDPDERQTINYVEKIWTNYKEARA